MHLENEWWILMWWVWDLCEELLWTQRVDPPGVTFSGALRNTRHFTTHDLRKHTHTHTHRHRHRHRHRHTQTHTHTHTHTHTQTHKHTQTHTDRHTHTHTHTPGMEINFFVHRPLWLVDFKIYQPLNVFTSHFLVFNWQCVTACEN